MTWTIYCHTHVESGRRYVGLTAQTWQKRWKTHVSHARSSKGGRWHFPNAIRKYGKNAFSHEVLEICHDLEVANLAEECWIDFFDSQNPEKGFNLAKGGGHLPHPNRKNPWDDPAFRKKAETNLAIMNASWTPEGRSTQSRALWDDPDFRARTSQASKDVNSRPEARKRNSDAQKGKKLSPEHRAKIGAQSKLQHGRVHSAETRARISEAVRTKMVDPDRKISKGQTGKILSSETRSKIGDAARAAAARRKELGLIIVLSDEARARISKAAQASNARRKLKLVDDALIGPG
jgi:group I intron endonuclease